MAHVPSAKIGNYWPAPREWGWRFTDASELLMITLRFREASVSDAPHIAVKADREQLAAEILERAKQCYRKALIENPVPFDKLETALRQRYHDLAIRQMKTEENRRGAAR